MLPFIVLPEDVTVIDEVIEGALRIVVSVFSTSCVAEGFEAKAIIAIAEKARYVKSLLTIIEFQGSV